jgi:hypothetical protein
LALRNGLRVVVHDKIDLNAFRKTLEDRQTELGKGNRGRHALAIQTSPDELHRIQHAREDDMISTAFVDPFAILGGLR